LKYKYASSKHIFRTVIIVVVILTVVVHSFRGSLAAAGVVEVEVVVVADAAVALVVGLVLARVVHSSSGSSRPKYFQP
jgi:lipopolysaccharide export LptBFGC system permease protein LptF